MVVAMGVLRMIKMFGWEDKMAKRLARAREIELGWLWKSKVRTLEITREVYNEIDLRSTSGASDYQ